MCVSFELYYVVVFFFYLDMRMTEIGKKKPYCMNLVTHKSVILKNVPRR